MKSKTFKLIDKDRLDNCVDYLTSLPLDNTLEVVIRNSKVAKTMRQLGGLFGVWYRHLEASGFQKETIHAEHKREFLEPIYLAEPANVPQDHWADSLLLWSYRVQDGTPGAYDTLEQRRREISLSWATVEQMTAYMNRIEEHYQSIGYPLPILERDFDYYKRL